jgi:hypothetical protein
MELYHIRSSTASIVMSQIVGASDKMQQPQQKLHFRQFAAARHEQFLTGHCHIAQLVRNAAHVANVQLFVTVMQLAFKFGENSVEFWNSMSIDVVTLSWSRCIARLACASIVCGLCVDLALFLCVALEGICIQTCLSALCTESTSGHCTNGQVDA